MPKVLVAEDTESLRADVVRELKQSGFDVLEALDGQAGFELAKTNNDISLILTDQNMPNMTGIEMVRALRGTDAHKKTLVVFYTTESKKSFATEAEELNVKGWLIKPVKADLVVKTVSKLISAAAGKVA
jgi:two-component system chemotaxis response regulator CheY